MEEALEMLNAVMESIDAAILVVDSDFKVVLCNCKFGHFFGLDPQSLIGDDKRAAITRDIKWRVKSPEDFQKRLFWLYDNPEVVANDEVEVSLPRRRVLHRFSGPVYDDDKNMLGRVEVYTDITEEKRLHEELELKNSHLYLLNAAATAINDTRELSQLSKVFLQRIKQATSSQAGMLYIEENQCLRLKATTGTLFNLQAFPQIISEEPPKQPVFWSPEAEQERRGIKSLSAALKGSFYIVFPAVHQDQVLGICILIWDQVVPRWLHDSALFENIGMQLGIGIHNAAHHDSQLSGNLHANSNMPQEEQFQVHLSPREQEVLQNIAEGLSNKEIAKQLNISEYTVKNHVRNILGKMCVKTRGQAVAKALSHGILATP